MLKKIMILVPFFATVCATGCNDASNDIKKISDRASPSIIEIETTPTPDSLDISVQTAVSVTFNEAMDESTVSASFTLDRVQDDSFERIAGSILYIPKSHKAVFTPNAPLLQKSVYTATVNTSAADVAGNSVVKQYQWTFQTTDRPEVQSISLTADPAALPEAFPRDASLTLSFSEPLQPESLVQGVRLLDKNGNAVAGLITWQDASHAVFTPEHKLGVLSNYALHIVGSTDPSGGVTDLANNAMKNNFVFAFKTVDGKWGEAKEIAFDDEPGSALQLLFHRIAGFPCLSVDGNGNGLLLYARVIHRSDGDIVAPHASRYTASNGWEPENIPLQIDNKADHRVGNLKIAMDADGNAIAIWQRYENDDSTAGTKVSSIYTSRFDTAKPWTQAWSTVQTLEEDNTPGHDAAYPQIAFQPDGQAVAAWSQTTSLGKQIIIRRFSPVTGWEKSPAPVEYGENVQLAFDAGGKALLVWENSGVYARRYTIESGWTTPVKQLHINNSTTQGIFTPRLALDKNGNAMAAWQQNESAADGTGTVSGVFASRYDASKAWQEAWESPKALKTSDFASLSAHVAVDSIGNAMVVWAQAEGANRRTYASYYSAGQAWSPAKPIDDVSSPRFGTPQFAFDSEGNGIAIWSDGLRVAANRYDYRLGWRDKANTFIAVETGLASLHQITITPQGEAIAAWFQSDTQQKIGLFVSHFE